MANITRANGTLTLAGNWDADDIALFQPVLRSWSFYGQYGIQHCDKLSEQKKSASFYGCGRWGFREPWNPSMHGHWTGSKTMDL